MVLTLYENNIKTNELIQPLMWCQKYLTRGEQVFFIIFIYLNHHSKLLMKRFYNINLGYQRIFDLPIFFIYSIFMHYINILEVIKKS